MSCIYPSCMMGAVDCPNRHECDAEDERRHKEQCEQKKRDKKEQELRIKLMEQQVGDTPTAEEE